MLLGCMLREMHVVSSAKTCREQREQQDEELALFRDMFKREKERNLSLLQPDSVELEPGQGTYLLHKLPPGRKDFLSAEGSKNDYDWLKTPPATPLFPSLEMETNHPSMVIHTQIPLLHPFKPSRFKGKSDDAANSPTSASLSSSSSQPLTPNRSAAILERPPNSTAKPKQSPPTSCKISSSPATTRKLARETLAGDSAPPEKPNSSIVSLLRSRIPPIVTGFSGKPPANLTTAAASSGDPRKASSSSTSETKLGSGKQRKQSRSPALARSNAVVAEVMNAMGTGGAEKDSKTRVGSGKIKSRALQESAQKHLVAKNTQVETNRLRNVKNINLARPRNGRGPSQQTLDKGVKITRGELGKNNQKLEKNC